MKNQLLKSPAGPIFILAAIFFVSAVIAFQQVTSLNKELVQSSAINYADIYIKSIAEFRNLYSSEVVANAKKSGMTITHDYHNKENAIPLPATFTLLFGERVSAKSIGASSRMYSPYPFPWNEAGGTKTDFQKQAWAFLQDNPDQPYYQFESTNETLSLRYAVGDKLKASCVGCHNSYLDTPKQDWKTGDVRGVMEVVVPLGKLSAAIQEQLNKSYLVFVVLGLIFIVGVTFTLSRLHSIAAKLRSHVEELEFTQNAYELELKERIKSQEEAERANKAKSNFLASMSHELRTPLNAIIGFSQLLGLSKDDLTPSQKKYVGEINSAGNHLLELINDLLELTKIESGKLTMDYKEVTLCDLFKECETLSGKHATDADVQMEYRCQQDVRLITDSTRLKQVLLNLVSNGIKYNIPGGTLIIHAEEIQDQIRIKVTDTGKGIDEENLSKLFTAFERLGHERSSIEGTGIGLVLSKQIIEQMGGSIGVESQKDQGSTFWIDLPRNAIDT